MALIAEIARIIPIAFISLSKGTAYILRPWTFLATAQIYAGAGQIKSFLSGKKHWTVLWCGEVVKGPWKEVRVGTRQMLSRIMPNNLMIGELGQGGRLAGLARLSLFSH